MQHKKTRIILAIILGAILLLTFGFQTNLFQYKNLDFQTLTLLVLIGYDILPTIAQQISISALTTQLLQDGFNPVTLAIISTFALLGGQMILYTVGMFIRRIHKGSIGDLQSKSHFLHKHHFIIYLMIPFVGILGDAIMLYSGHEKISPLRIIPFLIISNFFATLRWIIPMLGQIELRGLF